MSGVLSTVHRVTVTNPWRRFRDLGDEWTLHWHEPDEDPDPGYTLHDEKIISLRTDLGYAERRCTILHECLHAEHGPVDIVHWTQHEQAVRRETARLLLPRVEVIVEAMIWALSEEETAQILDVDVPTLRDRLRWLAEDERDHMARRLDEVA